MSVQKHFLPGISSLPTVGGEGLVCVLTIYDNRSRAFNLFSPLPPPLACTMEWDPVREDLSLLLVAPPAVGEQQKQLSKLEVADQV